MTKTQDGTMIDLGLEALETLDRISRHCPSALSTYFQCINRADKNGHVFFSRSAIDVDMSEEFDTFRANIKKLALENVLEWQPIDDGIAVTLVLLDEED
jgi:hypothetical protein